VEGCCKHGNESSGSIKCWHLIFLTKREIIRILKEEPTPQSSAIIDIIDSPPRRLTLQ
jgi:hypothetical protein